MVEGVYRLRDIPSAARNYCSDLINPLVAWINNECRLDLLKDVGETFINRILVTALGLVISIIVAHTLGPEGRGLYAIAVTITAVGIQIGNLGLHASNTYYVSKDRSLLSPLVGNSLIISLGLGGLGALIAYICFAFFPSAAPLPRTLFCISLATIPLGLGYLLMQNILISIRDIHTYNFIELAGKLLLLFIIVIFVLVKTISTDIFIGTIFLITGLSFIAAYFGIQRKTNNISWPSFHLFRETIPYGMKAYLTALLGFLVLRMDIILVKYYLGAEQAGYYAVAVNMADMVYLLPVITGMILFPRLSAMPNLSEKWVATRDILKGLCISLGALILLCLPVASPMIRFLFGQEYSPSIQAFIWLLPGVFFLGIETVAVQYLNSIGFPKEIVWAWLIATMINLSINLFFIPVLGITGASLASSISYAFICLAIFFLIHKSYRHELSSYASDHG